jgi:sugar lactone lactonase YvrE
MRASTILLLGLTSLAAGRGCVKSTGTVRAPSAMKTVAVDGAAGGLWWDTGDDALYLADARNDRILRWRDGTGFETAAPLPPGSRTAGLGQIVRAPSGLFLVTRHGEGGGVLFTDTAGRMGAVGGLDPSRQRIGLTFASDGALYDAWFVTTSGETLAAVGRLDVSGGERAITASLQKPIGLIWRAGTLYVSDEKLGRIFRFDPATPDAMTSVAAIQEPGLLALGPAGSLFTGGPRGEVRRVYPKGRVVVLASGLGEVRGVAWDPKGKRLFAVERGRDPDKSVLRIFPVE